MEHVFVNNSAPQVRTLRNWRVWAVLSAVSLGVGLIGSVNNAMTLFIAGESPAVNMRYWFVEWRMWWLMLVPIPFGALSWYLAERIPVHLHWGRHLLAASFLCYLHILAVALVVGLVFPRDVSFPVNTPAGGMRLESPSATFLLFSFPRAILWHVAIVGFHYALRFSTEAHARLREAAQLRSRLIEARLQALRSQLNPHFLYNVLNSISVLAQKNDTDGVMEIIDRLGTLLRTALDDTRPDIIPLKQELEFIEGYLAIERVRFGSRLLAEMHISSDVRRALVPAMILQPLVENAVKHGVAVNDGSTTVAIVARRDGDMLRLNVTDSGPGFHEQPNRHGGIGLSSTIARLEELYGLTHRFHIGETAGGGTTITVEIPYNTRTLPEPERLKESPAVG